MGRGDSGTLKGLDEIERIAPDLIGEEEAHQQFQFERALRQELSGGGTYTEGLAAIVENRNWRERLLAPQTGQAATDIGYLLSGAVEEIMADSGSIENGDAVRFALACYGVEPRTTQRIVVFPEAAGTPHLKRFEGVGITLCNSFCGGSAPQPRGLFAESKGACEACRAALASLPENDPLRQAAEESYHYPILPKQVAKTTGRLGIDHSEEALYQWLKQEAVTELRGLIADGVDDFDECCELTRENVIGTLNVIGAEAFDLLTVPERIERVFAIDATDGAERHLQEKLYRYLLGSYPKPEDVEWPVTTGFIQRMHYILRRKEGSAELRRALYAAHLMALVWPEAARAFFKGHKNSLVGNPSHTVADFLVHWYPKLLSDLA